MKMKWKGIILGSLLICSIGLQAQKYVGGDISLLPKYEQNGAKYFDREGSAITDMLSFFRSKGMNAMRV